MSMNVSIATARQTPFALRHFDRLGTGLSKCGAGASRGFDRLSPNGLVWLRPNGLVWLRPNGRVWLRPNGRIRPEGPRRSRSRRRP